MKKTKYNQEIAQLNDLLDQLVDTDLSSTKLEKTLLYGVEHDIKKANTKRHVKKYTTGRHIRPKK